MTRSTSDNSRNIWPTLLLCAVLLAIGGAAGFLLRPVILPEVAQQSDESEDDPDAGAGHGSNSIVVINEKTLDNMNLKYGKFETRDYFQKVRIPAQVVERIPQSRRSVSAPIAGIVKKVFVAQGQAVRPGEKLFDLRITDHSIADLQVDLLKVFGDLDVSRAKKERLVNLGTGVVAGKQLMENEFEIKKLTDLRTALIQEMRVRGMNEEQIKSFIKTRQLAKDITIYAPSLDEPTSQPPALSPPITPASAPIGSSSNGSSPSQSDDQYFIVETVQVPEGTSLELGDLLCSLTHHRELLIKGLAFEGDIEKIANANQNGWKFTAQFGEGSDATVRDGLSLYQVENHVDTDSKTFPVLVQLQNEILNQTSDSENRTFINWRFKPGQRAHLEVPVEMWESQVVAPLEAVVREGPETFVFMKIGHTHTSQDGTEDHEFQKVPVKILHSDSRFVVLKKSERLDIYEKFALDQAYQLNLALKLATGGGGGHGHDHPHPH